MDDPPSPRANNRHEDGTVEDVAVTAGDEASAADSATGGPPARSAPARAAAEVLTALAHTIRSFILYDAANERIHSFLKDLRAKFEGFLAAHGEMALDVHPWEITLGDETVYSDPDRERSLAFRLYRDGVRRLTIRAGLEWDELVTLIGILSIRYKGVRTQEDDVVTLLWRAGFRHVQLVATEGVVASEDDGGDGGRDDTGPTRPRTPLQAAIFNAPYAFDYPWPTFTQRAAVEYRAVPPSLLGRIAEEDGEEAIPNDCFVLARELLGALAQPEDPLTAGDVVPALREMATFLAGEQAVDPLLQLARVVAAAALPGTTGHGDTPGTWIDAEVVRRLIESRARGSQPAPEELVELLDLVPGDHLDILVDLFVTAPQQQVPRAVVQLLESQVHGRSATLVERLATLDGERALELLQVIGRGDAAGAAEAAAAALFRPEEPLQLAALEILDGVPYGAKVGRALVGALASPSVDVRLRAIASLERHRERRAFSPLLETLRRGASGALTASEGRAIGAALARLDPEQARPLLREWVRPGGFLGRLLPGQALLRSAAVSGLAVLPGKDSEELLTWLAAHASGELKGEAEAALREWRSRTGGNPG
jgi:hypothetical protein